MDRKGAVANLNKTLLEEVVKGHLLSDPKKIPQLRDSEDCIHAHCLFHDHEPNTHKTTSIALRSLTVQDKMFLDFSAAPPDSADGVWVLV